jgi:hypothetical protein
MWRLVEVEEADAQPTDLTDSELIGASIILTHHSGEPYDDVNVYWRARQKIQPAVRIALDKR